MADIARRLAPEDLSAVTAFLAAERLPANTKAVAAEAPRPARKGRKGQPAAAPEPPPMHCGAAPLPVTAAPR
jgi:hypothetical protein